SQLPSLVSWLSVRQRGEIRPESVSTVPQCCGAKPRGPMAVVAVFGAPSPQTTCGKVQRALGREADCAMHLMSHWGDRRPCAIAAQLRGGDLEFCLATIRGTAGGHRRAIDRGGLRRQRGESVLNGLELADRPAELAPIIGVAYRLLQYRTRGASHQGDPRQSSELERILGHGSHDERLSVAELQVHNGFASEAALAGGLFDRGSVDQSEAVRPLLVPSDYEMLHHGTPKDLRCITANSPPA